MKLLPIYIAIGLLVLGIFWGTHAHAATPVTQVVNGGTGWGLPGGIQAGALLYGNGKNSLSTTTQGIGGQVLAWLNGKPVWTATSTINGTPGGLNTQVQYNNNGVFGGVSGATTNGTILSLTNPLLGGATLTTSSVNGVTLTTGGGTTTFLNANGAYSVPTGSTLITAGAGISTTTSTGGAILVSNTGVLSNIAGNGISVSGATGNVTITNTIGYPFPGNATTTLLTLSNGATVGNPFTLSGLGAGELYTNSSGLVGVSGTTTASCSGATACTPFTIFGSSPVTITGTNTTYTAAWPITLTGTVFGFNGLSTTTNLTVGQVPYVTGVNTFGQEATSSIQNGTNITVTNGSTAYVLGAQPTISLSGVVAYANGGTGSTTAPEGQLLYGGAASYQSVPTTTVTCTGIITCSAFTTLGASPVTINATGGGSGTVTSIALVGLDGATPITTTGTITAQVSTSTVPTIGGLAYWTGNGTPSTQGTVATSSIGAGTGLTFSGTAGAQVGGTGGTYSVNTTQNITTLSNLTVAGFVQTTSGGALSSAALTSGQVTTALGFTPYNATNPSGYISNITGLVTQGTNVTITGAGTSGSPYVINSSGGGTNFWTSSSGNIYNNTGARVQFPAFDATSTTATSTIVQSLTIGTGSNAPLVLIGSTTPTYGYLPEDRLDIVDSRNDYSALNVYNLSNTSCATADLTTANNLDSTALNFIDLGHTSSSFTGVGCTNNPFPAFGSDSSYLFDPSGNLNFALGSTSVAQFRWFTGGYTTANQKMVLTNAGNLGIGTTSPYAQLSVAGGNLVIGATAAGGTPGDFFEPKYGTPAGAFAAFDPTGKLISTTTPSGGSGITAITGPTGLSFSGTPTSVGTLATGYSIKELPSWTVGAAGADFTTIQAALTQCGTVGGGNIYLVDPAYAQGTTGLTWRGSNCSLWGRGTGTTTISFTGATTGIKTNTPASGFTHDEIHNVLFSADNNASDVAIDWSDMTHGVVDNVQVTGFARGLRLNDTQNITFYNSFTNMDLNAISVIGIDASSTNPVNGNYFNNIFIGSTVSNVVAFQMNNGNGNTLNNIFAEPGSITGTVGLKIFDNNLATNNGVFNNTFSNWYIEANAIGISIALTVNPGAGGIQRNSLNNMTVESNTVDWSVPAGVVAKNNFICGYDSNFGNCLTSFAGPLGDSTSTELGSISQTPFSFFGVNASSSVATNAFVIDNQVGSAYTTDLLVSNTGYVALGGSAQPSSRLTLTDQTGGDASVPTVFITGNNTFAKAAPFLKISNNNTSDTGNLLEIDNTGKGDSLYVNGGNLGIASSSAIAQLSIGMASTTSAFIAGVNGSTTPAFEIASANANGAVSIGTTLTLSALTGTQCLQEISGLVSGTGSACGSGGATFAYPFTPSTDGAVVTSATSTALEDTHPGLGLDVANTSWYGIGGALFAYASSTNEDTILGLGAGGGLATTSASLVHMVAIGMNALHMTTTGGGNVAVGFDTLEVSTTGVNNTAIGDSALLNLGNGSSGNIAIGAGTDQGQGSGSDNIAIGQNSNEAVTSGSRQLNIGNLIYGINTYNGGSGSSVPTGGTIGIGTTTPFATLSISSTSPAAFAISDAFNTTDLLFSTASTTGSIFTIAATTSPSIGAPIKLFDVDQYGHLTASSTGPAQPTVSCAPSGGTLSATSNDDTGTITGGTLSTSCTVTFARAYAVAPVVQTTGSNVFSGVTAQSTTAFTVTMAATTGDTINYWVVQP